MKNFGLNITFFEDTFSEARMRPYYDRYPGDEKKAIMYYEKKYSSYRVAAAVTNLYLFTSLPSILHIGKKIKPSGNGFENGAQTENGRVVIPSNEFPFDESYCNGKNFSGIYKLSLGFGTSRSELAKKGSVGGVVQGAVRRSRMTASVQRPLDAPQGVAKREALARQATG